MGVCPVHVRPCRLGEAVTTALEEEITSFEGVIIVTEGVLADLKGVTTVKKGEITTLDGVFSVLEEEIASTKGAEDVSRGVFSTKKGVLIVQEGVITVSEHTKTLCARTKMPASLAKRQTLKSLPR